MHCNRAHNNYNNFIKERTKYKAKVKESGTTGQYKFLKPFVIFRNLIMPIIKSQQVLVQTTDELYFYEYHVLSCVAISF